MDSHSKCLRSRYKNTRQDLDISLNTMLGTLTFLEMIYGQSFNRPFSIHDLCGFMLPLGFYKHYKHV